MNEIISNESILNHLLKATGTKNHNRLAIYLEEKYGIKNGRQKINQFKNAKTVTITTLFFNELLAENVPDQA